MLAIRLHNLLVLLCLCLCVHTCSMCVVARVCLAPQRERKLAIFDAKDIFMEDKSLKGLQNYSEEARKHPFLLSALEMAGVEPITFCI